MESELSGMSMWDHTSPSKGDEVERTTESNQSFSSLSKKYFYSVHIAAVVSLAVSLLCSLSTLVYLQAVNKGVPFWKRRVNDRMVAYLAVVDLLYSSEHSIDHVFALITGKFPPGYLCEVLGFLLAEFASAQSIIVSVIALSAFSLIVREKPLSMGKRDWRLLVTAYGLPFVAGAACFILGYYGPSRAWCMADETKPSATMVNNIYSSLMIACFCLAVFVYTSIWVKVSRTSELLKSFATTSSSKSLRLAKNLSLLVAAYFTQWSPFIVYALWSFSEPPHPVLLVLSTISCNLGGLYNMVAYTVIRRKQQPSETKRQTKFANLLTAHTKPATRDNNPQHEHFETAYKAKQSDVNNVINGGVIYRGYVNEVFEDDCGNSDKLQCPALRVAEENYCVKETFAGDCDDRSMKAQEHLTTVSSPSNSSEGQSANEAYSCASVEAAQKDCGHFQAERCPIHGSPQANLSKEESDTRASSGVSAEAALQDCCENPEVKDYPSTVSPRGCFIPVSLQSNSSEEQSDTKTLSDASDEEALQ